MTPSLIQRLLLKLSASSVALLQWLHFGLIRYYKFPARSQLPNDLDSWNEIPFDEITPSYINVWSKLGAFFEHHGFILFKHSDDLNQYVEGPPAPSNYAFLPVNDQRPGKLKKLSRFGIVNGCQHAVRSMDNRHYVIRVMTAHGRGLDHLNIMRFLSSQSPDNLLSNNHILPMVKELVYEDIVFGVFPMLGERLLSALMPAREKSSVEDVVYMIMQALEAVTYIHSKNIAHRDLFLNNFMLEWSPQSLLGQSWTRPRVYLIDFETAVHFPEAIDPANRLTSGLPFPASIYGQEKAPELLVSESHMYCPFRLDMWQFGHQLVDMFSTTEIPEIDTMWHPLMAENPAERPTARKVLQKLEGFVASVPPQALQRTWNIKSSR